MPLRPPRLLGLLLLVPALLSAEPSPGAPVPPGRPFIWVTAADRQPILDKVASQPWARAQHDALVARTRDALAAHRRGAAGYLRQVRWERSRGEHPALARVDTKLSPSAPERAEIQGPLLRVLGEAVDAAVLHYLTGEDAYAALAADVLQAYVRGLRRIEPSEEPGNGGWVFPIDHLYEARAVGAQLPIVYDLVWPYLSRPGTTVLDLATGERVPFAFAEAQEVFRTYVKLAAEHGMQTGSNWTVLETPSLLHNALALDDPAERAEALAFVTHVDTPRQDPLTVIFRRFREDGGIWPESFQYAADVAELTLYVVTVLRRLEGTGLQLPEGFDAIPRSLIRLRQFTFPNGDYVRLGDGPRSAKPPHHALEMATLLAAREGSAAAAEFGGLLAAEIASGDHDRSKLGPAHSGPKVYLEPLSLLWFLPVVDFPPSTRVPLPRTDVLPFAGLVLQRNLARGGDPGGSLMAVVHGASFIHGHASGMSLELFGAGFPLGTPAGKGTYRSDEHENYRRLFAAYNGVIVDGSSSSSGGWVNLGTDKVRVVAMEPAAGEPAISRRFSFTATAFTDKQLAGTTAEQERTVGIVRTGARGGYYVDVFRSRRAGDGAGQFHDYVYHNIGNAVSVTTGGAPVALAPEPGRFKAAPGTRWQNNVSFLFPGWHFFKDTRAGPIPGPVVLAEFTARQEGAPGARMRVHLVGGEGREIATVMAPPADRAPGGFAKLDMPTIVVRQLGEAWDRPFAAIFEARLGLEGGEGVERVEPLLQDGRHAGFRVTGTVDGQPFEHLVIVPAPGNPAWEDASRGIAFTGRYAVVSLAPDGSCSEAYVGDGTRFACPQGSIDSEDGSAFSFTAVRDGESWKRAGRGRVKLRGF